MLEADIAVELEKYLQSIMVLKKIPAWQAEAQKKLTAKLADLLGEAFRKTVVDLTLLTSVPPSGPKRRALNDRLIKIEEEFQKTIADAAVDAANRGRALASAQTGFRVGQFSETYANLIRYHTFEASHSTMERMRGEVMDSLAKSYEEGLGIGEAGQRLSDKFEAMETYELERIARTEIQSHQNQGAHDTLLELGVGYEQWWSAQDERVRGNDPADSADHTILHGQITKVGERFSNGLAYPGDRSGPIEEWINCRCRPVAYLVPEGYKPPPGLNIFYESQLIPIDTIEPEAEEKPEEPIARAKTIEEAEELARERLAVVVDYSDTDLEVANLVNKTLDKYYKKYDIEGRINAILPTKRAFRFFGKEVPPDEKLEDGIFSVFGARHPKSGDKKIVVAYSEKNAKTMKAVKQFAEKLADKRIMFTDGKGMLIHEFGHLVDFYHWEDWGKPSEMLAQEMAKKYPPGTREKFIQNLKDDVGRYILQNPAEFFAEAFRLYETEGLPDYLDFAKSYFDMLLKPGEEKEGG